LSNTVLNPCGGRGGLVARIASRTRRAAGRATGASVLAFPWSIGMAFTYPAAVLANWASHLVPRHLRRQFLASFPHRIFAFGPGLLIAPGLEVGLATPGEIFPPCRFERSAGSLETGGASVSLLAGFAARIEAAMPLPRIRGLAIQDRSVITPTRTQTYWTCQVTGRLLTHLPVRAGRPPLKRARGRQANPYRLGLERIGATADRGRPHVRDKRSVACYRQVSKRVAQ
jgi:hypothetical protein